MNKQHLPREQQSSAPAQNTAAVQQQSGGDVDFGDSMELQCLPGAGNSFAGSLVQSKSAGAESTAADPVEVAQQGVSGGGGALPHGDTIQASFGQHDISGVQAHQGAEAQQAAGAIGANAYATGSDVAFASTPDLHTAAHEAAHVVQQQGGVSLKGGMGEAGDRYEQHADQVADTVVAGKSAEGLLDSVAGGRGSSDSAAQRSVQLEPDEEENSPFTLTATSGLEDPPKWKIPTSYDAAVAIFPAVFLDAGFTFQPLEYSANLLELQQTLGLKGAAELALRLGVHPNISVGIGGEVNLDGHLFSNSIETQAGVELALTGAPFIDAKIEILKGIIDFRWMYDFGKKVELLEAKGTVDSDGYHLTFTAHEFFEELVRELEQFMDVDLREYLENREEDKTDFQTWVQKKYSWEALDTLPLQKALTLARAKGIERYYRRHDGGDGPTGIYYLTKEASLEQTPPDARKYAAYELACQNTAEELADKYLQVDEDGEKAALNKILLPQAVENDWPWYPSHTDNDAALAVPDQEHPRYLPPVNLYGESLAGDKFGHLEDSGAEGGLRKYNERWPDVQPDANRAAKKKTALLTAAEEVRTAGEAKKANLAQIAEAKVQSDEQIATFSDELNSRSINDLLKDYGELSNEGWQGRFPAAGPDVRKMFWKHVNENYRLWYRFYLYKGSWDEWEAGTYEPSVEVTNSNQPTVTNTFSIEEETYEDIEANITVSNWKALAEPGGGIIRLRATEADLVSDNLLGEVHFYLYGDTALSDSSGTVAEDNRIWVQAWLTDK